MRVDYLLSSPPSLLYPLIFPPSFLLLHLLSSNSIILHLFSSSIFPLSSSIFSPPPSSLLLHPLSSSSYFLLSSSFSFSHMYMRQSTADSAISSDSADNEGSGWGFNMCKHNIEQEEAEALAKVRSMEMQDIPHPSLSGLSPPTPEVLIHVQASGNRGRDVSV